MLLFCNNIQIVFILSKYIYTIFIFIFYYHIYQNDYFCLKIITISS